MSSNRELMQHRSQAIPYGIGQIHPTSANCAENCRMWDVKDHEYLDFASGTAVLNTGRLHSKVVAVVEAQLKKLSHICSQVLAYGPYLELCEVMNQKVSGDFAKKTLLVTIGFEAVENAAKTACAATKRGDTIAFSDAYYGHTCYALVLTGKVNPYPAGMGLMSDHVYYAFYPCPPYGISEDDAIASIHRIFKDDTAPEDIIVIVTEPAQGEDGFYVVTPAFMQRLRTLYGEHGIMLIVDEVQSSIGRTDMLLAMGQIDMAPDPTTFAKSIAGGFPLAGVTGRTRVMDTVAPGGLGGTYISNPIACIAALEVLKVFEQKNLLQKANDLGQRLRDGLLTIVEKRTKIDDICGLGAMIVIELFKDGDHNKPDARLTAEIVTHIRDRGLVLLFCGPYNNVLRILVSLTIEGVQVRQGLKVISQCLTETEQQICTHAGGDAARLTRLT